MADKLEKYFKTYDYISRYESFPYFYDKINNRYFYGLSSNIREDLPYILYKVKPGDSYDSIAYDHYGNALFYWVICDFNRIADALSTPEVNTELKLPALNSVVFKE